MQIEGHRDAMRATGQRIEALLRELFGGEFSRSAKKDGALFFRRIAPIIREHRPDAFSKFLLVARSAICAELSSNQDSARRRMGEIYRAEMEFKYEDLDGNGVADFWVADVNALLRCIEGGAPGNRWDPSKKIHAVRDGYRFLPVSRDASGRPYAQGGADSGQGPRSIDSFAYCAVPERYRGTGRQTYLVNESGTVWVRDTRGKALEQFPAHLQQASWYPVEDQPGALELEELVKLIGQLSRVDSGTRLGEAMKRSLRGQVLNMRASLDILPYVSLSRPDPGLCRHCLRISYFVHFGPRLLAQLISQALRDPGEDVVDLVAHSMRGLEGEGALLLEKALDDPDPAVRLNAARLSAALSGDEGRSRETKWITPGVVSRLKKGMEDKSGRTCVEAAHALWLASGRDEEEAGRIVSVITTWLNKGDEEVRAAAARCLGKDKALARPSLPQLREALGDSSSEVRAAVARALAEAFPDTKSAEDFFLVKTSDPSPRVRAAAWIGLERLHSQARSHSARQDVLEAVAEALRSDPIDVRIEAARAAGAFKSNSQSIVQGLLEALSGPEKSVRAPVVAALERILERGYSRENVRAICNLVSARLKGRSGKDSQPDEVARSLVPLLVRLLYDPYTGEEELLRQTLIAIGPSVVPELAEPSTEAIRHRVDLEDATRTMAALGGSAVPKLKDILSQGSRGAQVVAARALAAIAALPEHRAAARQTVPLLRHAVGSPEDDLRLEAVLALWSVERAPDQVLLPVLRAFSRGEERAARALAEIADQELDDEAPVIPPGEPEDPTPEEADGPRGLTGIEARKIARYLAVVLQASDAELTLSALGALSDLGPCAAPAASAIKRAVREGVNRGVREAAIRAAGALGAGAPESLAALTDALRDEDPHVRWEALRAIGKLDLGGPNARRAVEGVLGALGDEEEWIRGEAVGLLQEIDLSSTAALKAMSDALARLGGAADSHFLTRFAFDPLARALEGYEPGMAEIATQALARLGPAAAVRMLRDMAEKIKQFPLSGVSKHRFIKVFTLLGEDSAREIIRVLQGLPTRVAERVPDSPHLRAAAASALGAAKQHAALSEPDLVAAARGESRLVRRYALAALGRLETKSSVLLPVLLKALSDSDRGIRGTAFDIFKTRGVKEGEFAEALVKVLCSQASTKDSEHFLAMAYVLGRTGRGASAVPFLIGLLQSPEEGERQLAARALGNLGPQAASAVQDLVLRLQQDSDPVQIRCANALADIGEKAEAAVPALASALQDDDWRVASAAAYALGKIGPRAEPAVPKLIARIAAGRKALNSIAALGCIGPAARDAVPHLMTVLARGNAWEQKTAARSIGQIGWAPSQVVQALSQALKDNDSSVRVAAAEVLGAFGPKASAAVPALKALEKDRDGDVCHAALVARIRMDTSEVEGIVKKVSGDKRAAKALAEAAARDPAVLRALFNAVEDADYSVRNSVAWALGSAVKPESYAVLKPVLMEAIKKQKYGLQQATVHVLRAIGPPAIPDLVKAMGAEKYSSLGGAELALAEIGVLAIPALVEAMEKGEPKVRCQAALVLGLMHEMAASAVEPLIKALGDTDGARAEALKALGRIGPAASKALPSVRPLLQDPGLCLAAAKALWNIGREWEDGLPVLLQAMDKGNGALRTGAIELLGTIGPPVEAAAPALAKALLKDKDSWMRTYAAKSLAQVSVDRPEIAVPALVKALEDEDSYVRTAAADALGALGTRARAAAPALKKVISDPNEKPKVKRASENALKAIEGAQE